MTHDHCTAALIFRIDKGQRGGTDLAGLCFALVIRSGKVMADGDWVFAGVVDEQRRHGAARSAVAIVSGEAGGTPGMIRSNLVSDFRGVAFKPIEFKIEGLKRSVSSPTSCRSRSRAWRRATAAASRSISTIPRIRPAGGLRWRVPRQLHVHGFGLDLDMVGKGNNGHFAPFAWAA